MGGVNGLVHGDDDVGHGDVASLAGQRVAAAGGLLEFLRGDLARGVIGDGGRTDIDVGPATTNAAEQAAQAEAREDILTDAPQADEGDKADQEKKDTL